MNLISRTLYVCMMIAMWAALPRSAPAQTPVKVIKGKLTGKEPKDAMFKSSPHAVHVFTFEKDKYYLVQLESDDFDAVLRLEDVFGNKIGWNDDGGGKRHARISFGVNLTNKLRLIVTAYPRGKAAGSYRLTIRTVSQKERKKLATTQQILNLNRKVLLLLQRARWKESLPPAQRAVALAGTVKGLSPHVYDSAIDNLAVVCFQLSKYKEGALLYQQLLKFRKDVWNYTESSPANANLYRNLAGALTRLGQTKKARAYFQLALSQFKKKYGMQSKPCADVLDGLALSYRDEGHFDKSWSHAEKAMEIRKAIDPTGIDYALSLTHLSSLKVAFGQFAQALELARKAVDLVEKKLGPDHPDLASPLSNLATAHMHLGRYDKALVLEQRAADIHKSVTELHPHYSRSLEVMAFLYSQLRQNEKALTCHLQAADILLKSLGPDHPQYIRCASQLPLELSSAGKFGEALRQARKMMAYVKKTYGPEHPKYARSLEVLAVIYRHSGRPSKALPLFLKSREIVKSPSPSSDSALGNVYLDLGRWAEAAPLFQRSSALTKQVRGGQHPLYAQELRMLAHAYWAIGRYRESAKLLSKCQDILRLSHDHSASVQTYAERIELAEAGKAALNNYLIVAQAAKLDPSEIYEKLLQWKGNVLARQAEEQAILDNAELRPLVQKIWALRAKLAKLYQTKPANAAQTAAWKKNFAGAEGDLSQAEKKLAVQSQTFDRYQKLRAVKTTDVIRSVPQKTAFIEFAFYIHGTPLTKDKRYWTTEKRLLAFVFRPNQEPVMLNLGAALPIERLANGWRRALTSEKSLAEIASLGKKLQKRIWLPLEKHLSGADTVIIAPDGILCRLPFAALPGRRSPYLIEEKLIAHVTSGQHYLQLRMFPPGKTGDGLLAFGGIDYGTTKSLPPLPATKLEVFDAQSSFKKRFGRESRAQIHSGTEAKKQLFSNHFVPGKVHDRYRYLHLATHGEFEKPDPLPLPQRLLNLFGLNSSKGPRTYVKHPMLRCSLAFAGANTDRAGGILTGKEISVMDMRGVDLAVLSACDSGLGRVDEGEGVLGLQQAFHMAGCRTVIASLWSLDDAATAVLVKEFYKNHWHKKMTKLQALRQAQLTLMRNPKVYRKQTVALLRQMRRPVGNRRVPGARDADRSHPAFWAGLVLSGDPGLKR